MEKQREADPRDGVYLIEPSDVDFLDLRNRPVRKFHVSNLAEVIAEDGWQLTGQPIILAQNGQGAFTVIDGQHRIRAVATADRPILSYVIFLRDRKEATFDAVDTGKSRSTADRLTLDGHTDGKTRASIISWCLAQQEGRPGTTLSAKGSKSMRRWRQFADAHQRALDHTLSVVSKAKSAGLSGICEPSLAGWVHFNSSKINQKKADNFILSLASGTNLSEGNACLRVREIFRREAALDPHKKRLNQYARAALLVSAWNKYVRNQPVTILKVPRNFPDFAGLPLG